ncbi:CAAX prenyl protease 1 like protein [Nosema granulosis]|uniref:CAAX prenyl protease n=1 Tax=Nosema granulosis TaxID=83296 RepID=A0A9P6GXG9_9MICR|nr:CAAX prenyl protease 1 like protein [Nosema granulosis]
MIENIIIASMGINLVVSFYLKFRQLMALTKGQTETTRKIVDEEQFEQIKDYNKDKLVSGMVETLFSNLKDGVLIYFRYLQFVYDANFRDKISYSEVFFFLAFFHFERLINIPFNAVNTFFIEARHGFNKTTLSLFVCDFLKSTIILTILLGFVIQMVLKLVSTYVNFYFYLWVFMSLFQLSMVVIYPLVIQPLFNKFTELEEGSLKEKIASLSEKIGFSTSKIFVMDGSKRSGHSNAYFIGITKEKRIVLYDTLLTQLTENEILAVLCHEFGHWYHSHTIKLICKGLFEQLCYLYVINVILNCESFKSLIFYQNEPTIIKLIYLSYVLGVLKYPMGLLSNFMSRMYEREADKFAVKQDFGEDLSSALIKLNTENKSNLSPDPMFSAFYHSHPTLVERLELIEEEMKKSK